MKVRANAPVFFNPNTDWGPQVLLVNLTLRQPTGGPVVALAIGDNDLYTVPAGRRAVIMSGTGYNTTGVSVNVYPTLKVGGTTYRLSGNTSIGALSGGAITTNFIYEPGDIIGANASGVGINYDAVIVEFDETSPVKTARVLDTINGVSTIYTLPAGKVAYPLSNNISTAAATVNYCGTTGTPTLDFHLVPSGGVTNGGNQLTSASAVVANQRTNPSFNAALRTAGDSITVNSTGVGAIVFVHISEFPA